MNLYSVDFIVRDYLLKAGYPLHWYMQSLLHATDCLSDLYMDDLHVVHTRILPVSETGAVDLPEGYTDAVGVFIKVGDKLQPLTEDNTINPLQNFDSDFNVERYDSATTNDPTDQSVVQISGLLNTYWFGFAPYDSLGEPTGRFYGIGNPTNKTYRIVKERNEIQLNENLSSVTNIVLQWIGDGRTADALSSIESYALPVIRQYIRYGLKDCNRTYSRNEVEYEYQKYLQQRRTLRSRKSNLTMTALRKIVYKNYRLSASK